MVYFILYYQDTFICDMQISNKIQNILFCRIVDIKDHLYDAVV